MISALPEETIGADPAISNHTQPQQHNLFLVRSKVPELLRHHRVPFEEVHFEELEDIRDYFLSELAYLRKRILEELSEEQQKIIRLLVRLDSIIRITENILKKNKGLKDEDKLTAAKKLGEHTFKVQSEGLVASGLLDELFFNKALGYRRQKYGHLESLEGKPLRIIQFETEDDIQRFLELTSWTCKEDEVSDRQAHV